MYIEKPYMCIIFKLELARILNVCKNSYLTHTHTHELIGQASLVEKQQKKNGTKRLSSGTNINKKI